MITFSLLWKRCYLVSLYKCHFRVIHGDDDANKIKNTSVQVSDIDNKSLLGVIIL